MFSNQLLEEIMLHHLHDQSSTELSSVFPLSFPWYFLDQNCCLLQDVIQDGIIQDLWDLRAGANWMSCQVPIVQPKYHIF